MLRRDAGASFRHDRYAAGDSLTIQLAHRAHDQKLAGGELTRFALDVRAKHGADTALGMLIKLVNRYADIVR